MNYFKDLLALLSIEREADRRSYQELAATTSVFQRRENGMSWFPIAIRGTEIGRADYLTVEIERTTHQDIPHQLRFGQSAALFSNHNPKDHSISGTITFQGGDRLKLSLRTEELPDWASDGKLGVDLLFDEASYAEMETALREAEKVVGKSEEGQLARILTGVDGPSFRTGQTLAPITGLNPSQQAAVEKILAANELAIVHGPPGTGKTTTIIQAIREIVRRDGQKVLVTAPSNAAVDLLSDKLSEAGLNVLRVGNPAKVSERLMSLTLDSKMAGHEQMKEIRKWKKQSAEFRNMAHKYKRNFGRAEREQRQALFDEARKIMKDVARTEQYITEDLLAKAQIITATLVGANHYTVRALRYHTVVIDEAGQGIEPASWIPALKGEKLILAGDHLQLPPTIKSEEAARKGLASTLLEKLAARHPEAVTLLEEQYRMNERIMQFSSEGFYEGRLKAHPSVAGHTLFPGDDPLMFIDTAGTGFDEKAEGTSTTNPEEARFLIRHLASTVAEMETLYTEALPTIAVISPYKMQLHELHEALIHTPALAAHHSRISVNTIDSFQGQERDVVYISMTRSNSEQSIGFLSDIRRMNVAMTRARKKLVVVGDSGTLSVHPFYKDFISYAEKIGGYRSAWEWKE